MDARRELVLRVARRRERELGGLSPEAFEELLASVERQVVPAESLTPDERALSAVAAALERLERSVEDDDLLDDERFEAVRSERLERLARTMDEALEVDPGCVDALLLRELARGSALSGIPLNLELADGLRGIERDFGWEPVEEARERTGGAWNDVLARPRMRVRAALARTYLDSARYRQACELCSSLVDADGRDPLGARLTWALALARLEDEEGLNELSARFGHHGNAWFHLARTLLLHKLGRPGAARRALRGYCELCEGGAYALLNPAYVDTYLPDRPSVRPGSFEETVMAVYEADPVIADTPDFVDWAASVPGVSEAAGRFRRDRGLD